ncbi:hypothetical protein AA313_de0203648 [Arthrobotrys entomopaga]|nr:hypothetical protein AA313_de0203648 [Arthrobotrys entomopaga]
MNTNSSEPLTKASSRRTRRSNFAVPASSISNHRPNMTDNQYRAHMEYLTNRMTRLNTILKEVDDREEAIQEQYKYYCATEFAALSQYEQAEFGRLDAERHLLNIKTALADYEHTAIHHHAVELGLGKVTQCDGAYYPNARCWENIATFYPRYTGMQRQIKDWMTELWMEGETLE